MSIVKIIPGRNSLLLLLLALFPIPTCMSLFHCYSLFRTFMYIICMFTPVHINEQHQSPIRTTFFSQLIKSNIYFLSAFLFLLFFSAKAINNSLIVVYFWKGFTIYLPFQDPIELFYAGYVKNTNKILAFYLY